MRVLSRFAGLALALSLAACGLPAQDPLEEDLPDMGDFRLAFNIVVADNMQQVPPSRRATPEEWEAILQSEIDRRFGAYEGERLYHIALAVDGYSLAPPGIPLVLSPKSILVVSANVWDDELGEKLHEEPNQITVFEGASAASVIGSGLVRSREEQMQVLARNMARRVQLWMLENPDWFNIDPEAAAADAAAVQAVVDAEEPDVTAEELQAQAAAGAGITPTETSEVASAEPASAVTSEVSTAEPAPETAAEEASCVPSETVTCPEPATN